MTGTTAPLTISVRNLAKTYGSTHLMKDVNIDFLHQEFTVVLGPSGCGKSTLLRMIAGLEEIKSGEIRIGDRDVTRAAPKDRGCAMVFQNYALYPHMTVRKNICYGLKLAGLSSAEQTSRAGKIATMLGLEHLLDRLPSQLSGGQRQRVAIGRAIARQQDVLLFDEPLSNLDASMRNDMRVELRKLHDQLGCTSIFVTHDQIEAMTLADRIIVMNQGCVEQVGTPTEIYHRPANEFVARFIGTPPMNLMPASLSGHSIRLADGQFVSLPLPDPASLPEHGEVKIGIRPENLRASPVSGAFTGTVTAVDDLGSHYVMHCAVGGSPVLVTQWTIPPDVGTSVWLDAQTGTVSYFDGRSGERLGSG
ncbi:ABC transporter ATP-binding protein [Paraburkholderia sp.]|uniref:ABC transporter ATP-binding protein n=1 Tax=Paraburkholderia sp. TaxID=1926495 RepID=UPI0025E6A3CC|nr:sn-glycerol-3-phosphate ABC transporter ATP-binding protein UgpC [Paraburkholderia sp.]